MATAMSGTAQAGTMSDRSRARKDHRGLKVCKVRKDHKARKVHRGLKVRKVKQVCKARRASPACRVRKALPVCQVSLVRKVRKVWKANQALPVCQVSLARKVRKVRKALPALPGPISQAVGSRSAMALSAPWTIPPGTRSNTFRRWEIGSI